MSDPTPSTNAIQHIAAAGLNAHGAFIVLGRDGIRTAEMLYAQRGDHIVIDHTWVDDSLRSQGFARKLLDALVAWARETGTLVRVTCKYAKVQFEKDPSIQDVLAD
ncbi:MAG: GNAT family N-acetyltransferase [Myxococcota bacterium]